MEPNTGGTGVELVELRMHPRHKDFPGPDRESASWAAFVTGLSAAGSEGIPPLVVTPDNQIMDGERRFLAAKQLGWERVPVVRQPESDWAAIMVDSLMGQRHLTKGAKVYLAIPLVREYLESAQNRRLRHLRQGVKTCEKPFKSPSAHSVRHGKDEGSLEALAERLGACPRLLDQAIRVRKVFQAAGNHRFELQDGRLLTLKEYFEPKILDGESPMGLGEVLKGCGWFVDEEGRPRKQGLPGERNSYLHYFEASLEKFNGQFARWEKLREAERERALELLASGIREWPAEVRAVAAQESRRTLNEGKKVEAKR